MRKSNAQMPDALILIANRKDTKDKNSSYVVTLVSSASEVFSIV